MIIRDVKLTGTTDGSGDATINGESQISGTLLAVQWIDGDLVDGVDAVLSMQDTPSGIVKTILTLTNANNDAWHNVRELEQGVDGANLTTTCKPLLIGKPRLVISSGGDTKTGGCILYYADGYVP